MKKVYLITGGFGHLGYNLVSMLLKTGDEIRVFENSETNLFAGTGVGLVSGDIRRKEDIERLFEGVSECEVSVIHCAGIVSIASKYDQTVYDVNVTGTKNMVDASLAHGVSRFIYVSSVHAITEKKRGELISEIPVYEPDKVFGLYAKTKAEASNYVLKASRRGLNASIVNPSGMIGPGDRKIGHTTRLIVDYLRKRLISGVRGGYDFVDVRDVCDGIIRCLENGNSGESYILSGHYISVKELLDTLHNMTGQKKIRSYLPMWFIEPLAPLAEAYYKIMRTKPLFTRYSLYTLRSNGAFSHEKASRELGYLPRGFTETLRDTVLWLEKEGLVPMKYRAKAVLSGQ